MSRLPWLLLAAAFAASCHMRRADSPSDAYAAMAQSLAGQPANFDGRRLAVLPFPYMDGRVSQGPRLVQEALGSLLSRSGRFDVLERSALAPGVEDLAEARRGLLDARYAAHLRRTLDVDAALTGSLVELPDGMVLVSARLVRLPDGVIAAAAEGTVRRSWPESEGRGAPSWTQRLWDSLSPGSDRFHASDGAAAAMDEGLDRLRKLNAALLPLEQGLAPAGRGRWVYERDCRHCHGIEGQGSPGMAAAFAMPRERLAISDKPFERLSAEGLRAVLDSGKTAMPRLGGSLTAGEISDLLAYLQTIKAD